ncbi:hypothetical protein CLW00_106111 [Mongoliibacter ruber]|uniref:Uncharacterized protein n=1 Tax=Mongoliibacter ruber TaxID=1750599 RepID=A0A2T0WLA5_9BACT|nr:hypothetical protein CLW00_106111 [Mongoliibacter ruber]
MNGKRMKHQFTYLNLYFKILKNKVKNLNFSR